MQNPEILEIKTDTESVCIPTKEYHALVQRETLLDVIFALRTTLGYNFDDAVKVIEERFFPVSTEGCDTCNCTIDGTATGADNASASESDADSESHA